MKELGLTSALVAQWGIGRMGLAGPTPPPRAAARTFVPTPPAREASRWSAIWGVCESGRVLAHATPRPDGSSSNPTPRERIGPGRRGASEPFRRVWAGAPSPAVDERVADPRALVRPARGLHGEAARGASWRLGTPGLSRPVFRATGHDSAERPFLQPFHHSPKIT